ncbi:MAG: extensin-like protein [Myxococcales bacterium]|nr:extensin-like protein [Myxococcales bacterium]
MKKAFDQNVSRAKPRLRLGAIFPEAASAQAELQGSEPASAAPPAPKEEAVLRAPQPEPEAVLAVEVKARAERSRSPKLPAVEAVKRALFEGPPRATAEPPSPMVEVQTPAPLADPAQDARERREKLRERLAAVKENPRPEPLPPTVAEAGVLAVERISSLQAELSKLKALNLSLTQDLESARRQSERATEEARLRMDEAKRLSAEMEARAKLLLELERELESLEGERDEALLALQESRRSLDAAAKEQDALKAEIGKRDQALAESLAEEERLASELEQAHRDADGLRRSADALRGERDTLARQVADLTRERSELLQARKALQEVHRALAQAVVR